MYLKNVVVTTKSGIKIELSYPKRVSKFDMEYEYVCDYENLGLDKMFDLETKVVNYLNGEEVKTASNSYLPIDKIIFVDNEENELKFKALIHYDKSKKDYSLSLMLVDRDSNVVESYLCDISMNIKREIHDLFAKSSAEIKNRMNAIDDLKIFFFTSNDVKDKKSEFFNNTLCLLKDTSEMDLNDSWRDKSYVSKSYLEKILGASIDKKYGLKSIFEDTMDNAFSKSRFTLNVDKILKTIESTSNSFCEFTLASVLVGK